MQIYPEIDNIVFSQFVEVGVQLDKLMLEINELKKKNYLLELKLVQLNDEIAKDREQEEKVDIWGSEKW